MNDLKRLIRIKQIFDFIEKCVLDHKTKKFVISLKSYYERTGDLSPKQYDALLNIYEKLLCYTF